MSPSSNPITAEGARALHQAWQTQYPPHPACAPADPAWMLLQSWGFQREVVPDQPVQWWVATQKDQPVQWVMGVPIEQGREWWSASGETVVLESWCAAHQALGHSLMALPDEASLQAWLRQGWSNAPHAPVDVSFSTACRRGQDSWSSLGGGLLFEKAPGTPPVDVELLTELLWFHFSCHPHFGRRILEDLNQAGVRATTVQPFVAQRIEEVAASMEPFGIQVRRSWAFPRPVLRPPDEAPRPPEVMSDRLAQVSETLSRRRRRY